jgi:hypothetical protein
LSSDPEKAIYSYRGKIILGSNFKPLQLQKTPIELGTILYR